MKILVTGAAGSLGSDLINRLMEDRQFDVYATDIKSDPFENTINLSYKSLDCRNEQFIHWVESIKPEIVIHLASILQISSQMTREMAYEIDVVATKALLETCVSLKVKKFIITTSGAVYGYYKENKNIITEQRSPRGNDDYFYSAHKAEVEKILAEYRFSQPQLDQLILRPGAILGTGFTGPIVDLFKQKIIVGVLGYPGPFNFICCSDVVEYLIEGIKCDITGEYNVAGDGILTMAKIAEKLNKFYLPLPAPLLQLILAIAKPLGLTQYGPEQIKFIQYRPVLANDKIKSHFKHQPQYTSEQVLDEFLKSHKKVL
ncbi:MAG: epimerase [Gammaproteobacteria bacterium]|nr:MAG: epimerase [Gammaproteobacteria bacterium]